jgi:hypothetical protein
MIHHAARARPDGMTHTQDDTPLVAERISPTDCADPANPPVPPHGLATDAPAFPSSQIYKILQKLTKQ